MSSGGAVGVPSVNGRPPSGTFEPLMIEGKYVHWAPLESLTLAGGHTSHLCYRQLTSHTHTHKLLLCALASSVASIKQGPLDVRSASAQHFLLILFNFQRHRKSDMKHPRERSRDRKALWKRISKAKARIKVCFLLHMFLSWDKQITLNPSHTGWHFLGSEFRLISEV